MMGDNQLLEQAAKDVPPDSSPVDDPGSGGLQNAPNDPDPDAGDTPGDGAAGDDHGTGRSAENVRRELLRKLEKAEARAERLEREFSEFRAAGGGRSAPPAGPQASGRIEDMSSAQLEAMRDKVPADQKTAFEQLLQQARVREAVRSEVQTHLSQQSFQTRRSDANQEAFTRYPELRDSGSKLRQLTNQVLEEMGQGASSNPRAVLDAANEAGMRLGLSPKAGSIMMHQHRTVGGRSAPAPSGDDSPGEMDQATLDRLSKALANAMPGGKFTKENLDNIRKSSALYRKHKDLIIRQ